MSTEELSKFPCLRRFLSSGFKHNPKRDAPRYGMICLENREQSLFVDPKTGYLRVGRNERRLTGNR
jgi:hypothetical protein